MKKVTPYKAKLYTNKNKKKRKYFIRWEYTEKKNSHDWDL